MIDRGQSLAGAPVLNEGVEIEHDENGHAMVRIRVERGSGFISRFQPPVMIKTVSLDELGTFVLNQIDGNTSVLKIIERFIERFRANRREAELSTAEFLKTLMRKGVISIAVK